MCKSIRHTATLKECRLCPDGRCWSPGEGWACTCTHRQDVASCPALSSCHPPPQLPSQLFLPTQQLLNFRPRGQYRGAGCLRRRCGCGKACWVQNMLELAECRSKAGQSHPSFWSTMLELFSFCKLAETARETSRAWVLRQVQEGAALL